MWCVVRREPWNAARRGTTRPQVMGHRWVSARRAPVRGWRQAEAGRPVPAAKSTGVAWPSCQPPGKRQGRRGTEVACVSAQGGAPEGRCPAHGGTARSSVAGRGEEEGGALTAGRVLRPPRAAWLPSCVQLPPKGEGSGSASSCTSCSRSRSQCHRWSCRGHGGARWRAAGAQRRPAGGSHVVHTHARVARAVRRTSKRCAGGGWCKEKGAPEGPWHDRAWLTCGRRWAAPPAPPC